MKYILTIDPDKKAISVSLDRPVFLRIGCESPMEVDRRKRISREYKNATLPDWLHDEVASMQKQLECKAAE